MGQSCAIGQRKSSMNIQGLKSEESMAEFIWAQTQWVNEQV